MLLVGQAEKGDEYDFVTLTLHEALKTNQSTRVVFERAWRKLYAALKRSQKDFSYVLVPELHKDGRMHVHIITNFHPPETYYIHRRKTRNKQVKRMRHPDLMDRFWKDAPRAYGFGYANDQEHIQGDTGKVAGYIAKYLAKQRKINQWPKNFKHVRASHGIPQIPEQSTPLDDFDWSVAITREALETTLENLRSIGFRMIDPTSGELIAK